MTSRERVLTALSHKEPDRVPFDCSFTYGAYERLCKHLGISFVEDDDLSPYLTIHPRPEVIKELSLDLGYLELSRPLSQRGTLLSKATRYLDEWGLLWHRIDHSSGIYFEVRNSPLANASLADLSSYPWPDPHDAGIYQAIEQKANNLRSQVDVAVVGKFGAAFFATAGYLRGLENFYIDLMENPDFARALLSRVSSYYEVLYKTAIEKIGSYLDIIRVDNDDFGSQEAPLISPQMYRAYFKDLHSRFYSIVRDCMRERNPHFMIMKHSCGSVSSFIPDFMEAGVEILNPLQPRAAGMDQSLLKTKFGHDLCFHGGIDTQQVMSKGTVCDIENEVKRCISSLAMGGGFICAPSHHIQDDVPPGNVLALRDSVLKWGEYPIAI